MALNKKTVRTKEENAKSQKMHIKTIHSDVGFYACSSKNDGLNFRGAEEIRCCTNQYGLHMLTTSKTHLSAD